MKHINSIADIAAHYDAFLIDLWGVMHDGTKLYSGAKEAIAYLHARGKKIIFLSNAPRKADKAEVTLLKFGIPREAFVEVVTSGQVAYDQLLANNKYGAHYYYLGPDKDSDILMRNGVPVLTEHDRDENLLEDAPSLQRVNTPEEADFIVNTGFEYDFQPEAEIEPLLQRLLAKGLPLLCANPDLEVVKQDGTQLLCAGWVARRYEELGGEVHYIGKPHGDVYEACFELLDAPRERILGIGDNFLTDIRGANAAGIDSLLITGGILRAENGAHPDHTALEALCQQTAARPTYVAELFAAS